MQELLDTERTFAENYIISLRKDLAAIAAGYSPDCAKQYGYQVYNKPHVKAYIEQLLDERTISAKETLKLISDTAQGNMSDYMFPVERLDIPKVKKGLQQIIDHLQYEIEIEQDFLKLAFNLTTKEIESSNLIIRHKELEIVRYDIELCKNPNAYRIVDGDPILVKEIELDLHSIVADKEYGKIKSYKVTKEGVQIELCDPDASKDRLARIHGLYEKDNSQSKNEINLHFDSQDKEIGNV